MDSLNKTVSLDSIPDVDFIACTSPKSVNGAEAEVAVSEFRMKELNGELELEPLLVSDKTRFVLFPIKHSDVRLKTKYYLDSHNSFTFPNNC